MLTTIVFSLNRAMQLEALLNSLIANLQSATAQSSVKVLYGASDERFEEGYRVLKKRIVNSNVEFVRKVKGNYKTDPRLLVFPKNLYRLIKYPYLRDFENIFNFKEVLEGILSSSDDACCVFLTDDSLFYRPVSITAQLISKIVERPDQHSFSLRHGKNIRNVPSGFQRNGEFYTWSFYDKDCDEFWSYSFSIDGHIYAREFLLANMRRTLYTTPNSLEGFLWNRVARGSLFSKGYAFEHSVLLSFPINIVQKSHSNESLGIDNKMLNDHYLAGYHLQYDHNPAPNQFQQVPRRLSLVRQNETIELI